MRHLKLPLMVISLLLLCTYEHGKPRAGPKRARAVDVYTVSDQVFVPGTRGAIRVAARGVSSMTRSWPLRGAQVTVTLSGKGKHKQLYSGRSDGHGTANVDFRLPSWKDGSYKMAVLVKSQSGTKKVERSVQLKRAGRVLLVTDKPIYQPRQTINMRALALGSHDLKPLGWEKIRFEVLDPKGNKVFKHDVKTNRYGIAATTFILADEIATGNYQIEAAPVRKDAAEAAQKTVVVKKYVLPKFKVAVETDRSYYLPRQTVKGTVRSDYFFGKPVAWGKVEIKASTFDGVGFKKFATQRGKTDKDGGFKFAVQLPGYFVGQPLLKGKALVRLEVKVTDTADHPEKGTRSVPVAAEPIRVTAIPEGGRLVPDVQNRIYVVATYPDGSPARATISVKHDKRGRIATLQTDPAGVATLDTTPRVKHMRQGSYRSRVRAGRHMGYYYTQMLDLTFEAKDQKGNRASVRSSFSTDPEKDVVLLRTDKAIYNGGDVLQATVLTTGGGADTVYMDLVKNRQTVLTRAVRLRGGKGTLRLPLAGVFGTVELHAYRIKSDGEMERDGRVLYVQPQSELKISVEPDKKIYRPGGKAKIRFRVTDRDGRPRAAALGVIMVDEAVYALQELKPGLEKVYFTLEKELEKPQYQIEFGPADDLPSMIKVRKLQHRRQRVAKVLLAKAKPMAKPGLWENPAAGRMQKVNQDYYAIRSAIQSGIRSLSLAYRTPSGKWAYRGDLMRKLVKKGHLNKQNTRDPFGATYTAASIEKLWPDLRARNLIPAIELNRLWQIHWRVRNEVNRRTKTMTRLGRFGLHTHLRKAYFEVARDNRELCKDPAGRTYTWTYLSRLPGFRVRDLVNNVHNGRVGSVYYGLRRLAQRRIRDQKPGALDRRRNAYVLPRDAVWRAMQKGLLSKRYGRDVWGRTFQIRPLKKARKPHHYDYRLRFYEVYSMGPDGKPNTKDDLVYPLRRQQNEHQLLAKALGVKHQVPRHWGRFRGLRGRHRMQFKPRARRRAPAPMAAGAGGAMDDRMMEGEAPRMEKVGTITVAKPVPAAPKKRNVRVRNYFPETLLFKPSLITDQSGQAELKLAMADSITTWRMTASANSAAGALGSVSRGVKVFQDFFVDLDLPVALTQNDEVSIPVVVYNYLKKPQRVRLELKKAGWFDLLGGGKVQELTIQPAEVAATYYRIQVRKLGRRKLQVRADGSAMSDAIRREIEVLPDGQEKNLVANGRLKGTVEKTLQIPEASVPGASKILVRLYPGVFSQVIEGMESMLRLPGG
jgi:hypothetical protein